MKVYLVQHGEAESKEVNPQRPLTEQGMRDVQRIAEALIAVLVSQVACLADTAG